MKGRDNNAAARGVAAFDNDDLARRNGELGDGGEVEGHASAVGALNDDRSVVCGAIGFKADPTDDVYDHLGGSGRRGRVELATGG